MTQLPAYTHRFFWDIDPTTLNVDDYRTYVIERLLEYGDPPSIKWMLAIFPRETIVSVLQTSHRLSALSANFWALYFDVDKKTVPRLSDLYQNEAVGAWPF
ncbi:MAG: DUF6922 domain-containing protein [Anaerolineae bacterium]